MKKQPIKIDMLLTLAKRWIAYYCAAGINHKCTINMMLTDAYMAGYKEGHALLKNEIDEILKED